MRCKLTNTWDPDNLAEVPGNPNLRHNPRMSIPASTADTLAKLSKFHVLVNKNDLQKKISLRLEYRISEGMQKDKS